MRTLLKLGNTGKIMDGEIKIFNSTDKVYVKIRFRNDTIRLSMLAILYANSETLAGIIVKKTTILNASINTS